MARKSKGIALKKRTIIFCEGETEQYYFEMLKRKYNAKSVEPQCVKTQVGACSAVQLVNYAVAYTSRKKFDSIYVIYDRDDLKDEQVIDALKLAKENGIITIYSNVCFELWVLLHYVTVNSYMNRKELYGKLKECMKLDCSYRSIKGEKVSDYLFDLVATALKNANQLSNDSNTAKNINCNPYTNIHHYIKDIFQVDRY